jgi:hypothetical protein
MVNIWFVFIILCRSVKCIKQEWHRTHAFKIEQAFNALQKSNSAQLQCHALLRSARVRSLKASSQTSGKRKAPRLNGIGAFLLCTVLLLTNIYISQYLWGAIFG